MSSPFPPLLDWFIDRTDSLSSSFTTTSPRGLSSSTERDLICGRLTAGSGPNSADADPPAPPDPVPADAATFWASGPLPAEFYGDVRLPPVDAAGPKRLGGFPFWRGTDRFLDSLVPTYSAAARRGLSVFEAETTLPASDTPEETGSTRRAE